MDNPEAYPEKLRQYHDKLIKMQALRLNKVEQEITQTMRALEKIIKHSSKSGDGVVLKLALDERNRVSDYLHSVNKG